MTSKTKDYITTTKVFAEEFKDLGVAYETVAKLKRDEELNCIVIYKVDNYLDKNKFVLYYQEKSGYLRKIKLKVTDISEINKTVKLKLGEELKLDIKNGDNIIFDNYEIGNNFDFNIRQCDSKSCYSIKNELESEGLKILKLDFASDTWEAKNMIDFLTQYGKLIYKDSNGIVGEMEIVNPIDKAYYGKTVFIKISGEVEYKEMSIDLIVRNKHYVYKLF